jgi:hypothetical protein
MIPPHALVATPTFEAQAKRAGITEDEMSEICDRIAADPQAGDVIPGTGGARKLRHRSAQGGKSAGYRTIHYWGGDDVPVFLLGVYAKGQTADLTQAQRDGLRRALATLADAYRAAAREAARTRPRR